MKSFHLTVARVGENIFDGDAHGVTLPGTEGVFTVLAGHEALVTPLKAGVIQIQSAAGEHHHVEIVAGGVAEISNNQVTILL